MLRPSFTPGTMFFISAKTGTPAEMLPQFILYVRDPGKSGKIWMKV